MLMDPDLLAYDEAWRTTDKSLRNAVCQDLADAYVLAHPELEARYGGMSIPACVALLEAARDAGDEEKRIELDIWINAAFEYQQIGGEIATSGAARAAVGGNVDGVRRTIGGQ